MKSIVFLLCVLLSQVASVLSLFEYCNPSIRDKYCRESFGGDFHTGVVNTVELDLCALKVWDNDLAEVAQIWADQCANVIYGHNDMYPKIFHERGMDRTTKNFNGPPGVGQNVAWALTKNVNFSKIIDDLWYKDINNFQPGYIKEFNVDDADGSLMTQIIWGRTTHVGCGWIQFPMGSHVDDLYPEGEYENFFVCNYGVGGNVPGEPVYDCLNKEEAVLPTLPTFGLEIQFGERYPTSSPQIQEEIQACFEAISCENKNRVRVFECRIEFILCSVELEPGFEMCNEFYEFCKVNRLTSATDVVISSKDVDLTTIRPSTTMANRALTTSSRLSALSHPKIDISFYNTTARTSYSLAICLEGSKCNGEHNNTCFTLQSECNQGLDLSAVPNPVRKKLSECAIDDILCHLDGSISTYFCQKKYEICADIIIPNDITISALPLLRSTSHGSGSVGNSHLEPFLFLLGLTDIANDIKNVPNTENVLTNVTNNVLGALDNAFGGIEILPMNTNNSTEYSVSGQGPIDVIDRFPDLDNATVIFSTSNIKIGGEGQSSIRDPIVDHIKEKIRDSLSEIATECNQHICFQAINESKEVLHNPFPDLQDVMSFESPGELQLKIAVCLQGIRCIRDKTCLKGTAPQLSFNTSSPIMSLNAQNLIPEEIRAIVENSIVSNRLNPPIHVSSNQKKKPAKLDLIDNVVHQIMSFIGEEHSGTIQLRPVNSNRSLADFSQVSVIQENNSGERVFQIISQSPEIMTFITPINSTISVDLEALPPNQIPNEIHNMLNFIAEEGLSEEPREEDKSSTPLREIAQRISSEINPEDNLIRIKPINGLKSPFRDSNKIFMKQKQSGQNNREIDFQDLKNKDKMTSRIEDTLLSLEINEVIQKISTDIYLLSRDTKDVIVVKPQNIDSSDGSNQVYVERDLESKILTLKLKNPFIKFITPENSTLAIDISNLNREDVSRRVEDTLKSILKKSNSQISSMNSLLENGFTNEIIQNLTTTALLELNVDFTVEPNENINANDKSNGDNEPLIIISNTPVQKVEETDLFNQGKISESPIIKFDSLDDISKNAAIAVRNQLLQQSFDKMELSEGEKELNNVVEDIIREMNLISNVMKTVEKKNKMQLRIKDAAAQIVENLPTELKDVGVILIPKNVEGVESLDSGNKKIFLFAIPTEYPNTSLENEKEIYINLSHQHKANETLSEEKKKTVIDLLASKIKKEANTKQENQKEDSNFILDLPMFGISVSEMPEKKNPSQHQNKIIPLPGKTNVLSIPQFGINITVNNETDFLNLLHENKNGGDPLGNGSELADDFFKEKNRQDQKEEKTKEKVTSINQDISDLFDSFDEVNVPATDPTIVEEEPNYTDELPGITGFIEENPGIDQNENVFDVSNNSDLEIISSTEFNPFFDQTKEKVVHNKNLDKTLSESSIELNQNDEQGSIQNVHEKTETTLDVRTNDDILKTVPSPDFVENKDYEYIKGDSYDLYYDDYEYSEHTKDAINSDFLKFETQDTKPISILPHSSDNQDFEFKINFDPLTVIDKQPQSNLDSSIQVTDLIEETKVFNENRLYKNDVTAIIGLPQLNENEENHDRLNVPLGTNLPLIVNGGFLNPELDVKDQDTTFKKEEADFVDVNIGQNDFIKDQNSKTGPFQSLSHRRTKQLMKNLSLSPLKVKPLSISDPTTTTPYPYTNLVGGVRNVILGILATVMANNIAKFRDTTLGFNNLDDPEIRKKIEENGIVFDENNINFTIPVAPNQNFEVDSLKDDLQSAIKSALHPTYELPELKISVEEQTNKGTLSFNSMHHSSPNEPHHPINEPSEWRPVKDQKPMIHLKNNENQGKRPILTPDRFKFNEDPTQFDNWNVGAPPSEKFNTNWNAQPFSLNKGFPFNDDSESIRGEVNTESDFADWESKKIPVSTQEDDDFSNGGGEWDLGILQNSETPNNSHTSEKSGGHPIDGKEHILNPNLNVGGSGWSSGIIDSSISDIKESILETESSDSNVENSSPNDSFTADGKKETSNQNLDIGGGGWSSGILRSSVLDNEKSLIETEINNANIDNSSEKLTFTIDDKKDTSNQNSDIGIVHSSTPDIKDSIIESSVNNAPNNDGDHHGIHNEEIASSNSSSSNPIINPSVQPEDPNKIPFGSIVSNVGANNGRGEQLEKRIRPGSPTTIFNLRRDNVGSRLSIETEQISQDTRPGQQLPNEQLTQIDSNSDDQQKTNGSFEVGLGQLSEVLSTSGDDQRLVYKDTEGASRTESDKWIRKEDNGTIRKTISETINVQFTTEKSSNQNLQKNRVQSVFDSTSANKINNLDKIEDSSNVEELDGTNSISELTTPAPLFEPSETVYSDVEYIPDNKIISYTEDDKLYESVEASVVEDLNYARSIRNSRGMGIGTIASITIGILVLFGFALLVFFAVARRRRRYLDDGNIYGISSPSQSRTTFTDSPLGTVETPSMSELRPSFTDEVPPSTGALSSGNDPVLQIDGHQTIISSYNEFLNLAENAQTPSPPSSHRTKNLSDSSEYLFARQIS
ncbi:CRISP [Lepeophtheirus salmonis]|uniref:CRISP n=1 Tax=Lepeophtheirus salmonis TaxID=72036 RepID=A0A7R8CJA0_LEPSM|nr:CRISP [Lepeophtheirus salmonis]CAF2840093.1 CRISP [Lepeophtheirus salmonis]